MWKRVEKLEAIELESSEKTLVYGLAKKLADRSGLIGNKMYQRITPSSEEELQAVKELHGKAHDKPIQELLNPPTLCQIFLNWNPLSYQIALLNDQSRQIAVRWTRQSGKTTSFAAKSLYFCITKAGTQALITAPSLRQSMIVSDKGQDRWMNVSSGTPAS